MNTNYFPKGWCERFFVALLFITIGYLIYIVFSPFRPQLYVIDPIYDYLGRFGLVAVLLATVIFMSRSKRYAQYGQIIGGLLIMTIAVSLDWIFAIYLADRLGVHGNSPVSAAMQKLNEFVIICSVVIGLTLMTGGSLGSLYIQKGRLKAGLTIGLIAFALAAAGSPFMATYLFKARDLSLERVLPWLPWLLIFVLANAAQEELLFRGLFLRKLEPFYGKFLSNSLVVFVFTFLHYGVAYTSSDWMFLAAIVPLALAWGYIMQKTDSIWGSILFHAGMDIPILLGIFSNY